MKTSASHVQQTEWSTLGTSETVCFICYKKQKTELEKLQTVDHEFHEAEM